MTDPTSPFSGGHQTPGSMPLWPGESTSPQSRSTAGQPARSRWSTTEPEATRPAAASSPGGAAPAVRGKNLAEGDEGMLDPQTEAILQRAPPWLISLIVHMVVLIVLGLSYITTEKRRTVEIEAVYSERIGEQLLDDSLEMPGEPSEPTIDKAAFSPSDLPPVDDPFAVPPPALEVSPLGNLAMSKLSGPIGLALTGREKGFKKTLLRHYGGTEATQDAVRRGLEWLRRNQRSDGSWALSGPFSDGASDVNVIAATAMALLAFQGDGHTHLDGEYRQVVKRGWTVLLKTQDKNGKFASDEMGSNSHLYSHALATIAICELYGMTQDSAMRLPAEEAIKYCVWAQGQSGGWRYTPQADSDTSVTGWFVMALQSARMAGLDVPSETLQKVSAYLDTVQSYGGSRYGYVQTSGASPAMTAEALLCRQYLGWQHDDPRLVEGANYLAENPIRYTDSEDDVYYWYYATQVMHHMEGKYWNGWNEVMRQLLPERQVTQGPENGSWNPDTYKWGRPGGRLFVTCLHIFMLEVYYRHLPMYNSVYVGSRE